MKKQLNLNNACVCGAGIVGKSNTTLCSVEEELIHWVRQKENIQPLTKYCRDLGGLPGIGF